jgi:hypothetical protein
MSAARSILGIAHGRPIEYPPNEQLTTAERAALSSQQHSTDLESGSQKVIASAMGLLLFDLFAILDGVADPEKATATWLGVPICEDAFGNQLFLHEELFPSYWAWASNRQ